MKRSSFLKYNTIGRDKNDEAASIVYASDGGYVTAGFTHAKGAGQADMWIVKLEKEGKMLWDKEILLMYNFSSE